MKCNVYDSIICLYEIFQKKNKIQTLLQGILTLKSWLQLKTMNQAVMSRNKDDEQFGIDLTNPLKQIGCFL